MGSAAFNASACADRFRAPPVGEMRDDPLFARSGALLKNPAVFRRGSCPDTHNAPFALCKEADRSIMHRHAVPGPMPR
ncbi:MAG: hypothetical protein AMXMBFR4_17460 [Candidatus Hydrogenedentota bacterium]